MTTRASATMRKFRFRAFLPDQGVPGGKGVTTSTRSRVPLHSRASPTFRGNRSGSGVSARTAIVVPLLASKAPSKAARTRSESGHDHVALFGDLSSELPDEAGDVRIGVLRPDDRDLPEIRIQEALLAHDPQAAFLARARHAMLLIRVEQVELSRGRHANVPTPRRKRPARERLPHERPEWVAVGQALPPSLLDPLHRALAPMVRYASLSRPRRRETRGEVTSERTGARAGRGVPRRWCVASLFDPRVRYAGRVPSQRSTGLSATTAAPRCPLKWKFACRHFPQPRGFGERHDSARRTSVVQRTRWFARVRTSVGASSVVRRRLPHPGRLCDTASGAAVAVGASGTPAIGEGGW